MRVEGRSHGADSRVQSRATVESKPAEPDENRAKKDKSRIMRFSVVLVPLVLPLSENQSICQSTAAGSDVDRASTGEVERGEIEEPTVGIPGPAGNGAVDDGRPAEGENHRRKDAATLE